MLTNLRRKFFWWLWDALTVEDVRMIVWLVNNPNYAEQARQSWTK